MAKQLKRAGARASHRKASRRKKSKTPESRFESLSAITKQITQLQETDRLLAMILEEASRLLRAEGVGIRVVVGDELRLLARTDAAKDVMSRPSVKIGESLSGCVVAESRPIAVYDLRGDSRHIPAHKRAAAAAGFQSFLGVPFRSQDKIIGTLSVFTKERRHFSQEEMDLVSAFADQAAVAIQNARLFEESNRRRKHAEALREIGLSLTARHDPQQVLDQVAEEARRLVGALFTFVVVPDKPFYRFVAVAGDDRGYGQVLKLSDDPDSPYGQGPLGRAIRTRKSVVCEDVLSDPLFVTWREIASERGIRSLVAVPLLVQEKPYGAILVYSAVPRAYETETLNLLGLLAAQAGAALENARLFEETQRRTQEQAALNIIAKATSQSLRRDELLEIALDKVLEVTGRERVSIRLKDAVTGKVSLDAHRGFSQEEIEDLRHRVPHRPSDQVFASGQPLVCDDRSDAQDTQSLLRDSRSVAWIPMKAGARVVGILGISASQPVPFSQHEVELLQAIGNVIGVALENARLYEDTQNNLQRMRALYEIGATINSTLDLHAVLDYLMEKINLFLPYAAVLVWLKSQANETLERAACWNLDENDWKGRNLGTPALVKASIEGKAPVVVKDLRTDPRTLDPDFYRRNGLISYLGVPLIVPGEVLGVLVFLTREEHQFTKQEVEFLSTLAGQAAMAIHNSQLHEQTKSQADDLETANRQLSVLLAELSRLYTALTPLGAAAAPQKIFEMAVNRLLQATGADAALFRVLDHASGGYVYLCQSGFPEDYLQRVRVVGRQSAADIVYAGGEPIIAADVSKDKRMTNKALVASGFHSCAFLPLKVKGEVEGVIHLASRQLGYFNEERREHLLAIARLMGIVIENGEMFNEIKRARDELEKAGKVKDEFLGFISHELRTPLNAVIAYTIMMQDKLLGEINVEQGQTLEKMFKYSKELLEMINSLLEVTRIQAGKVEVDIHKVDLGRFVDDLKASYDAPIGKPLTLNWELAVDLPSIRTDSGKLRHILQNLITNAIKYTERGTVSVYVRRCPQGRGVKFEVADTGIGIPRESLPVIFEMFRQVNMPDGHAASGVGLGLHIVRKFTEMLGGKIDVESEVGKGSTFAVTIPSDLKVESAPMRGG